MISIPLRSLIAFGSFVIRALFHNQAKTHPSWHSRKAIESPLVSLTEACEMQIPERGLPVSSSARISVIAESVTLLGYSAGTLIARSREQRKVLVLWLACERDRRR